MQISYGIVFRISLTCEFANVGIVFFNKPSYRNTLFDSMFLPHRKVPLQCAITDMTGEMTPPIAPSHILAVYSRSAITHQDAVLYPIHDLIFAANCTRFPVSISLGATRTSAKLPIIPLALCSPSSFPVLLEYLYTKDHKRLLGNLVCPSSGGGLESWSSFIQGFWENAVVLGVVDAELYEVIDDAWEIYMRFAERSMNSVSLKCDFDGVV